MKFMKFDEYLNSKGKTDEKPTVSVDGDNIDPKTMPNSPPGGGKPYANKDEGKKKGTSQALGDMGDDITNMPKKLNDAGKAAAKIPTVDEVALVSKVTKAAQANPLVMESMVRSIKNQGLLGALVAETLNHRETFKHLSQVMAHESYGPDLCTKLVRAMNEEVAPAFHDQLDADEESDEEGDMDMGDEEGDMDMGDEEGDMDMGDEEGDMDMGDEEGDMDMGDEEGDMDMGDEEGDMDMGDEEGDMDMGPDAAMAGEDPMDMSAQGNPALANLHKAMRDYMRRMMGKG